MKQIKLTQGKFTLVDDDIYELLNQYKWYAHKAKYTFYAHRHFNKDDNTRGFMSIQQCIVGFPLNGSDIDHIDGNGLNNQRQNLRIVTVSGNAQNTQKHRDGQLVGAYLQTRTYKDRIYTGYRSQILLNGKIKYLGYFKTELEAHQAYMRALNEKETTEA